MIIGTIRFEAPEVRRLLSEELHTRNDSLWLIRDGCTVSMEAPNAHLEITPVDDLDIDEAICTQAGTQSVEVLDARDHVLKSLLRTQTEGCLVEVRFNDKNEYRLAFVREVEPEIPEFDCVDFLMGDVIWGS